jgi:hypothetical protein
MKYNIYIIYNNNKVKTKQSVEVEKRGARDQNQNPEFLENDRTTLTVLNGGEMTVAILYVAEDGDVWKDQNFKRN